MSKQTLISTEFGDTSMVKINSNFDELYSGKEDVVNKSTSVVTDQASNTKYPSVKSLYDWVTGAFAKYSGDADFYQYSIVRTVASGNLTVALKNYLGNDPSPSVPLKIQIGDTVRAVTVPLTFTINAGSNTFNAGSAELATKEIDYFVYFVYDSVASAVKLGVARFPNGLKISDFYTINAFNEKSMFSNVSAWTATDDATNVGRFNAILSAGFAWSIPATSVIVNSPIYETRNISALPQIFGSGTFGTGQTYTQQFCDYKIKGDELHFVICMNASSFGTASGFLGISLPFGVKTQGASHKVEFAGYACDVGSAPMTANKGIPEAYNLSGGIFFHSSVDTNNLIIGGASSNTLFRVSGFYNI